MRTDEFDFALPEALIALRPVEPRSAARLLVAQGGLIEDRKVVELPQILAPGDLLIFNDTRVIPARLKGERRRDTAGGQAVARIEVTLVKRVGPAVWQALARPAKRLAPGDVVTFEGLSATVEARNAGEVTLAFDRAGAGLDAAVAAAGEVPLPPYIAARRAADARDLQDYQTVFARHAGSVAAPTASLHFDAALIAALGAAGIAHAWVTLHVGAGTFLPVTAERVTDHRMHAEWGDVPAATAQAIASTKAQGGRVIPVGTTALRLIETAARAAPNAAWQGETDIFITPGYRFRTADGLMTNFHLPRSTLMMLVSALMGLERIREIYAHAIAQKYRFFSYGDTSLLLPGPSDAA
ncbi:MAG: tRNA preQ1(34) S-adenosylmethionine ribosyltransferase-isomerase QueA [Pseudomonadota bacterium]